MVLIRPRTVRLEEERSLQEMGLSLLEARLYAARGITSKAELHYSLDKLLAFSQLRNAEAMASRLADAVIQKLHILIVGDYDVDGATATALGMKGLSAMGATVDFLVPNRFKYGHGLTPEIVTLAAHYQPNLIITVDNGMASHAGVEAARELGIEVLITDHHLPSDTLPNALIVNPNQPGCDFPSKNLAGVGVLFYVLMALRAELRRRGYFSTKKEPNLAQWLDLVALGTVADMVKLDTNNRILVNHGIKCIRSGQGSPGIMALFHVTNRQYTRASCFDLGFVLGPRLNAAGRLDDMTLGITCLLASREEDAWPIAQELDKMNRQRLEIEVGMREDAEVILSEISLDSQYSISLYRPDWHQGIIGILASRIKERFHRPTLVFADSTEGLIKGSGRSIPGLHLRDALDRVSKRHPELIIHFGGHAAAAGLVLRSVDFEFFQQAFELICRELISDAELRRVIETDGELPAEGFSLTVAEQLDQQVWGQGFPPPLFQGEFQVLEQRIVGERHLRLKLANAHGHQLDAIRFQHADALPKNINALFRISVNEFQNTRKLQLQIEHWLQ